MILRKEIIISDFDDGFVAVAAEEASEFFHGMIKLNGTGAFITNCLKEETNVLDVVKALRKEYDVSEEKARRDVERLVEVYRDANLLIE